MFNLLIYILIFILIVLLKFRLNFCIFYLTRIKHINILSIEFYKFFAFRLLSKYINFDYFLKKRLDKRCHFSYINLCNNSHSEIVSIVIPVNNGLSKGIDRLISSLKNQSHKFIEFIAVDSGSNDGTQEYLIKKSVRVIEIDPNKFSHSYSRNTGASVAKGEFLLFTVDDAEFDNPDWLTAAISILKYSNADSISTSQVSRYNVDPYAAMLGRFLYQAQSKKCGIFVSRNGLFPKYIRSYSPLFISYNSIPIDDTNHLVRRDVFDAIKYHGTTVEDIDFAFRLSKFGGRVAYTNLLSIKHNHSYSLETIQKYAYRIYLDWVELKKWSPSFFVFEDRHIFLLSAIHALSEIFYRIDTIFSDNSVRMPRRDSNWQYTSSLYFDYVLSNLDLKINLSVDLHPLALKVFCAIFGDRIYSNLGLSNPSALYWWKLSLHRDIKGSIDALKSAHQIGPRAPFNKSEFISIISHIWVNRLMSTLAQPNSFKNKWPTLIIDQWNINNWQ